MDASVISGVVHVALLHDGLCLRLMADAWTEREIDSRQHI